MKIILQDMNDINCFVTGSEFFDGIIDVAQKHYRINGKSLMSMCSLDLSLPIDVTITTGNKEVEEDYYRFLQKWSV